MEDKIINQAKKGNQKAQRELYDRFGRRMYALCLRYVRIQEDAEEILSNGFVKAFDSLSSFENRESKSFESWLKRILVNECLMFLRKQNKAPMMIESDENIETTGETVIEKLSADELFTLILKLPEGYRTVFNLFEIEGYSHPEIADKLGISVGTSKSQLSKAKAAMKAIIIKNGWNHAS
ncbi:RNA polymerase sigma factor [Algoriphagus litoralis]|uniref:RNA polymerase sigma factor n=1 Tax=Algoriphagus litoralis TaxID=2202829 RepID=UPI001E421438|nr:sigma-70 family RNA polymerase sigma factor [Algoriphagus litoralis]